MSGCACGVNAPSLIEVNGDTVVVFGLAVILANLEAKGCFPDEPDFPQALLGALKETGNRIPKGEETGYVTAIAEIFREYLMAKPESSQPKEKQS